MHAPRLIAAIALLASMFALSACSGSSAPAAPQAGTPSSQSKDNPLAGTALEDQGDALQKARGVEDTLQQSAEQRRNDIDEQAQ